MGVDVAFGPCPTFPGAGAARTPSRLDRDPSGRTAVSISRSLLWKVYTIGVGTASAIVAQKAVHGAWKLVTGGDTPPDPNDPDVPMAEAAIWALASGIGLGMAQLLTNRFVARRWIAFTGETPPRTLTTVVKVGP